MHQSMRELQLSALTLLWKLFPIGALPATCAFRNPALFLTMPIAAAVRSVRFSYSSWKDR